MVQTGLLLLLGVPARQLGTHGVLYTGTAAKRGTGATHQGHQEGREPEQKEGRMCKVTQNMWEKNLNNNTGSTIYSTDAEDHRLEKQRNTEPQHWERWNNRCLQLLWGLVEQPGVAPMIQRSGTEGPSWKHMFWNKAVFSFQDYELDLKVLQYNSASLCTMAIVCNTDSSV